MTARYLPTTPRDLTRWLEEAQHALAQAPALTVDHLRALAALPDTPGRDGTTRRTWWSEEMARVLEQKQRDKRPTNPNELDAWHDRHAHADEQIESLMDAHAEALLAANVRPPRRLKPTRAPKKSAAALALDATYEDAA